MLLSGVRAPEHLAASAADVLVLIVLARDRFAVHRFEVLLSGVRAPEHLAASAASAALRSFLLTRFFWHLRKPWGGEWVGMNNDPKSKSKFGNLT